MKGTYVIAILYVAILDVIAFEILEILEDDIPTKCPPIDQKNTTTCLAHETDCTKYYRCNKGQKGKPLDCPIMDVWGNRLHFNPKLQICDWPWNAGCQITTSTSSTSSSSSTSPIPSSTTTSTTSPTSPNTSTSSTMPNTITSSTSSSSSATSPIPSSTTTSSTTSSSSSTSSIPSSTTSSSPTSPTSSNTSTSSTLSSSSSTSPIPSSTTTSVVTTSSSSSSTSLTLPNTSTWPTSPTSTSSNPIPWTCESDGKLHLLPHETLCDHYYHCFNGEVNPVPKKCECHLLFNPKLRVCDYPENVICNTGAILPSMVTVALTTSLQLNTTTVLPMIVMPMRLTTPLLSSSQTGLSFPISEACRPNERIAHSCQCNLYYDCVDGEKLLRTCPMGKHFDYVRKICDWPSVVNCVRLYPTSNIAIRDSNIKCAPEGRAFQHDSSCSAYYLCYKGEKILKYCTIGLHFNVNLQMCNKPKKQTCNLTGKFFSTLISDECPPPGSTKKVLLPHECNCTQYYQCINGNKVLRYCPHGLHFNNNQQKCTDPSEANCTEPFPTTTTITPTTTIPDVCPPPGSTEKVFLPHECECTQYYECIDGKKVLRYCPKDKHFNRRQQNCTDPSEADCNITTTSSTTTTTTPTTTTITPTTTTTIPDVCPPPGSTEKVFLPHECECTQYYECIDGKKVLRYCPKDKHFNRRQQNCTDPSEADCEVTSTSITGTTPENSTITTTESTTTTNSTITTTESTTTTNSTITTTESTSTTPKNPREECPKGSNETARILHPDDCNLYYDCVNGEKVLRQCPIGQHFDYVREVCDWPSIVNCIRPVPTSKPALDSENIENNNLIQSFNGEKNNKRKIFDDLDPSTCIGTCPEEDPEFAVLLPNDDCKKFCLCSNGIAYVQPCPEPLYFDSVNKVCKQKRDAVCAVRPFSQDRTFVINEKNGNENLIQPLNDENSNGHEIFDNLDPSTCIGTCPEEDPEFAVLLPNDDCKKFCLCSNGIAYVQPCPEPLYFDSVDKVCKQKRDAVCAVRPFSQDRTFVINGKIGNENLIQPLNDENSNGHEIFDNLDPSTCIGTCPEEDPEFAVLLPNDDCKKFCLCSNGIAYVQPCPEPLYFDSVNKVCKQKRDAVCAVRPFSQDRTFVINGKIGNENLIQPLNDENSNGHEIFDNLDPSTCIGTCPEEDPEFAVLLPNDDCKKFCLCSNGIAYVQPCPEPLYFDSIHKVCKQKRDAVCAVRPFSQDRTFVINGKIGNENLIQPLNDENSNGHEIFDNLDPSTCIGTCPEEDPEFAVLLPNDDCKKFCLCSNGIAYVQPCPEPLYFDSVDKVCKQKRDAVCAVRPFSQDRTFVINGKIGNENLIQPLNDENSNGHEIFDNLDPSTCIGTCPEEDPEFAVLLPNDDCKKFCLCSNGIAYVQPCPEPLYFDSVDKVCKQKRDAVCAVRPFSQDRTFVINGKIGNKNLIQPLNDENSNGHEIFDNLDPSTCIGTCPEEDPEFAVLLPNDDCKKFCLCSNGIAYVQPCPEPLYFDSIHKVCKQKRDAVCAVRPFSQSLTFMINGKIDEDNMMQSENGRTMTNVKRDNF